MTVIEDLRDAGPPSRGAEVAIVAVAGAAVGATYWAERRYRRWARETSVLAGPRARAAAVQSSYQRKRSVVTDVIEAVGALLAAVELARWRSKAS